MDVADFNAQCGALWANRHFKILIWPRRSHSSCWILSQISSPPFLLFSLSLSSWLFSNADISIAECMQKFPCTSTFRFPFFCFYFSSAFFVKPRVPSPLHLAIAHYQYICALYLIDRGLDINEIDLHVCFLEFLIFSSILFRAWWVGRVKKEREQRRRSHYVLDASFDHPDNTQRMACKASCFPWGGCYNSQCIDCKSSF